MKQPAPTAFIHAPALRVMTFAPVAFRIVEVPAPYPTARLTITVSHARRVLLTKAVVQALLLKDHQLLDLVPQERGLPWLLDTQSRTGSPMRLRRDGKAWLTLVHHLGAEHFHRPAFNTPGRTLPTRTLTITQEDSTRPGIYLLQPD